ncbi:hypothetical protein Micbo1qcDRAFT_231214 [Microdochium bolleyi]|uniref:Uncharacterized protein n=1 Tax=Microdochium bolleyi TaxID=196109 RepID=A0A136JG33_9PEZI|nr:hypothetical protein Micbo1qcDRAFT_231214 [Microdochium bolleyi]
MISEKDTQRNNHSDDETIVPDQQLHLSSKSLDMPRHNKTAGSDQRLQFSDNSNDEKQERPPPAPLATSNGSPIHVHSNGSGRSGHRENSYGQRRMRPSEEFDRRFDGPFGRPSLAMTRRRSSQATAAIPEGAPIDTAALASPPTSPGGADTTGPAPAAVSLSAEHVPTFQPEPPALNYTLRTRKMAIFLFWTVIVFDSVVMPIALYFGLWYGVGPGNPSDMRLSANTVFSIVTAALGGASILEYFLRFWRLYKNGSTCRISGVTNRWALDWFHWMFSLAWIIVMIELIVGSVQHDPYIRLLSTPLFTMLYVFGTLMLAIDTMRYFQIPAPVRISSQPKGAQMRPGIYSLIEDICAVDGSGGTAFRIALDRRYEASHVFRAMLRRLGVFWAVGAEACAVLCTVLVFALSSVDIAYTIGWSVPFVWAGIWALATLWYVKRELKKERLLWAAEAAKGRSA